MFFQTEICSRQKYWIWFTITVFKMAFKCIGILFSDVWTNFKIVYFHRVYPGPVPTEIMMMEYRPSKRTTQRRGQCVHLIGGRSLMGLIVGCPFFLPLFVTLRREEENGCLTGVISLVSALERQPIVADPVYFVSRILWSH